ncbi:HutD family protein [Gluconobacter sp. R75690]|uniref:HutD/Ves family protein n=1 Tax=Gluconobacter TaxID=441 RepID=UPI00188C1F93|nr:MULTISPECIES: HutD family protein [unclassified Gluconobacter]MBF0851231.1 HutD family protein [Gluconobacter sp. R75690]MBF0880002.1 HutD family protein [Gluconobacter sp. R75828]
MKPDPENDNLFPLVCVAKPVDDLSSQPWKNGGGSTRVVASHDTWRLSVADITRDGAFSRFPGILRHIALLRGRGVRLSLSDGRELDVVQAGEILTFSGDLQVEAVLVDGPVQVVNLMHPFPSACRLKAVGAPGVQGVDVPCGAALVCARGRWSFEGTSGQEGIWREGDVLVLPDEVKGTLRSEVGSDALLYVVIPD